MRVLAVGAHPDDVELLCGGTLAKCAERGDQVFIAVATNGEVGSRSLSREQIAAVRHREAAAACEVIGATLIWMGFPDEWLFNTRTTRERFIDAVREASPDIMFVHGPTDYHPDHRVAGQVAVDARIPAAVPLVETTLPAIDHIPHIFVMDNLGGAGFAPEHYVDVTDAIATKTAMLLRHASQDEWLRGLHDDVDGIEQLMTAQTRHRGLEAGCRYAEGFSELKTYPRTGSYSLLP